MHSLRINLLISILSSEFTICGLFLQALLGLLRLCGPGSRGTPSRSSELPCGLWSEPLHIFLFSGGPQRKQNCSCFHNSDYTLLALCSVSVSAMCTWIQVPKPRLSAIDLLLAKYIWVGFLSGFSCPSQKLQKFSAAEMLCGTVKAWRLYVFLWRCDISYPCGHTDWTLEGMFSSPNQVCWYSFVCWDSDHRLSVLPHVTASVLSL